MFGPMIRRPRSSTVVSLGEAKAAPAVATEVRRILVPGQVPGSPNVSGAVQWLESFLKTLAPPSERFLLHVPFAPDALVTVAVTASRPGAAALDARCDELGRSLDAALGASFPEVRPSVPAGKSGLAAADALGTELRPAGQIVDEASFKSLGLRVVASNDDGAATKPEERPGITVAGDVARRPDLLALAHLMTCADLAAVTVTLEIERFERDAGLKRLLERTYQPLADSLSHQHIHELAAKDGFGNALRAHLAWLNAGPCQRVTAWVRSETPLSPVLLDMLCQAVYGVPQADGDTGSYTDLTRAWPDINLKWLERLPLLLEAKLKLGQRAALREADATSLKLGSQPDGTPLHLSERARRQHMFILGQTGTGKSTHIENLVAQDMEAGEAVIVFDAHGDLADGCLRLVPKSRKKDVILLHPTDPKGKFTINVFEPLGDRVDVQINRIANDLINLFKRVYPEPKEAYGPMFMSYCRNAIFLLLCQPEPKHTILDMSRVFADDGFRRSLIRSCTRPDVKMFWGDIAEDISDSGENASVNNVAPYIVAKLTQLSGNDVLAPIIGAPKSSVDFRKVVAEKRICIINLALPELGEEDAKMLGGLLFARLSASLQVQAKLAPDQRIPLRVYLDEVQTYADETLAQSMAQMRKFGLTYTLACQNFAQVDGGGWRPDVGRAILGNAANMVLFRLGYFDANMLATYLAPTIKPEDLMRLPNYHAAARVLNGQGQPIEPLVFCTDPPRAAP